MRAFRAWSAALLAWILLLTGAASAESRFDALCAEERVGAQQDVIAWLEIPGASYCEPVAQHPQEDSYYSGHDLSGNEVKGGVLYTQATYNAADFSDPVTIIYGSSTAPGMVFRDLQEIFSGSYGECSRILVHLPEGTQEYEVFAAVPYTSIHILHYYDFTSERRFDAFFDGVYDIRALGMQRTEGAQPQPGDRVLILSTGLRGDASQRYLVMAKQAAMNEN